MLSRDNLFQEMVVSDVYGDFAAKLAIEALGAVDESVAPAVNRAVDGFISAAGRFYNDYLISGPRDLSEACREKDTEKMVSLINSGVDPKGSYDGVPMAHYVVSRPFDKVESREETVAALKALKNNGGDLNAQHNGLTILDGALITKDFALAEEIVKLGGEIGDVGLIKRGDSAGDPYYQSTDAGNFEALKAYLGNTLGVPDTTVSSSVSSVALPQSLEIK